MSASTRNAISSSTWRRARLVTSVSWLPSTLFDIDLVNSGSTPISSNPASSIAIMTSINEKPE